MQIELIASDGHEICAWVAEPSRTLEFLGEHGANR